VKRQAWYFLLLLSVAVVMMNRRHGAALAGMGGPSADPLELSLAPVASGLIAPVGLANAGDSRLFAVEQLGRIQIIEPDGTVLATPFLDITDRVDASANEGGLLGLVFHPDYETNGYFYVNYIHTSEGIRRTRISRFSVTVDPNVADPNSEAVLLTVDQPATNHKAGHILFGPDGYLYIPLGDGGASVSAQDNGLLLGKIGRIDVDSGPGNSPDCVGLGTGNYTIPNSNPFGDGLAGVCDEIWAVGFRNPWRSSFDRLTGDLWVADVGQFAWEEVNFQPAASTGGENWGWRCYEGNHAYDLSGCGPMDDYTFPVFEYSHSSNNCTVIGGYVYRGSDYPALFGRYLLADYCTGNFWDLAYEGSSWTASQHSNLAAVARYVAFGEGVDGELYVVDIGGTVYRLEGVSTANSVPSDWFWQNPLPQGENLNGISCVSATFCKAVGTGGMILTWEGTAWNKDNSSTTSQLTDIHCLSAEQCKAVGAGGVILTWDGRTWNADISGIMTTLNGVYCASTTLCKAIGNSGVIGSWDGTSWSIDSSSTTAQLMDVSCPSPAWCKAVGAGGVIRSWDGTSWSGDSSGTTNTLNDVYCPAVTLCKAVGAGGVILTWDGANWSAESSGVTQALNSVYCFSISLCQVVGNNGRILARDGGVSWSSQSSGTSNQLLGVHCPTATVCKATGADGILHAWDGSSWRAESSGPLTFFNGVHCPSAALCKVVGNGGVIRSWNGASWSAESSGSSTSLFGVHCPTTTLCKVVGNNGTIRSWNGASWSGDSSGTTAPLRGVSCPSTSFCKAVGDGGAIPSWDGVSWSADSSGTAEPLTGVSCPTTTFCKAVGANGTIRAWDGTGWSTDDSGTAEPLNGVSCPTTTFCKAVGDNGTIRAWDGSDWSGDSFGTTQDLFGITCFSLSSCWAEGGNGVIRSWDGVSWSGNTSGTTRPLNGVSCPSADLCKGVGNRGVILGMVRPVLNNVTAGFALDLFNDAGCLAGMTITQVDSDHPSASVPLQTGRYWTITLSPPTCSSGFSGSLTLPATFTADEADSVCRYTGIGDIWDCAQNGFTSSSVRRDGIRQFSDWAASNDAVPTALGVQRQVVATASRRLVLLALLAAVFLVMTGYWLVVRPVKGLS
jgi:glucose/arabinose dehydrogenase